MPFLLRNRQRQNTESIEIINTEQQQQQQIITVYGILHDIRSGTLDGSGGDAASAGGG